MLQGWHPAWRQDLTQTLEVNGAWVELLGAAGSKEDRVVECMQLTGGLRRALGPP